MKVHPFLLLYSAYVHHIQGLDSLESLLNIKFIFHKQYFSLIPSHELSDYAHAN